MVPHLDLSARQKAPAAAPAWILAAAGAVLLALLAALIGWAAAVVAVCVAAGAGMTHLARLPLTLEERLAFGTVVGSLVVAWLILVAASAFGLSAASDTAALMAAAALGGAGWWRGRGVAAGEARDLVRRWRRLEPWPLWLLLAVAWAYTLAVLGRSYTYTAGGLVAGNAGAYADWAAHLAYAGSFAYGANFPPQFPIDPGHRLSYPFLIDLLAGALVPLGTSLTSAVVVTSGLLALAFPAVMYLAALRFIRSRGGAMLAVLVFALGGGFGFLLFFQDAARLGPDALAHLPRLYTQDAALNLQWLNPVLAWMLPQRSVLFGFSLALLVLACLWVALRPERADWAPFAAAGVVAGLTPLAHAHAYGTIVVLAAFWAAFSPRRQWVAFFAPALVLGLPQVVWLVGGGAAGIRVQPWWLAAAAGHHDSPPAFWIWNTGLMIPLAAAAFLWRGTLPARVALHLAPIWLWFLVPNFLVFQPWDWDNTKFFAYWAIFASIATGAVLARLFTLNLATAVVAAGLALSLTLAGGLDLARTLDPARSSVRFTDAAGVQTAAWVRANTAPDSVFLVAPEHNEPVAALGGRRVVVGYPGWLWTYGLADWATRTADARTMLSGGPGTPGLVSEYGVRYVVIGPQERTGWGASAAYWDRAAVLVYQNGPYLIYRVR